MGLNISSDYNVYCFDIFDTILSRTVAPEYVKKLWAKEIGDYFDISISMEEIYQLRNKSEASLCHISLQNGKDLEFRLTELYDSMYTQLDLSPETDRTYFQRICFEIELRIEKRVQIPCADIVRFISQMKKMEKKVICISDFYAPADFIKQLFEYHHILNYIDHFYISSEFLITKKTGKLYDLVLSELCQPLDQIIMIGDNRSSDYEIPLSKGMASYWIDRSRQFRFYDRFLRERETGITSGLYRLYSRADRDAYEDLSFTLYYFIQKLYIRLCRGKIKDVFFLSREGEFLKKLFDIYQENRRPDPAFKISAHYLLVSRKATFLASLKELESENFEMIFRQYVHISLFDFLSSLGFEEAEQNAIAEELQTDLYEKRTNLPEHEVFQRLRKSPLFKKLYEQKRIEQKKNFADYLNSFSVDSSENEFCIVDVGWKGTIQDNLFMFFEQKRTILGLYLGLVAPGKEHPKNVKEGLVFSNTNGISKYFDIFNENKSIFEVILGASHGSADHYVRQNDRITVITSEKKEERELFQNLIHPMQDGMEKVFREIDHCLIDFAFDDSVLEDIFADIHAHLVFKPVKKQIDLFYRIYHFENFGVFEFTRFKTKDKKSLADRVCSLIRLLRERKRFFMAGFWGVITLKDAGLSFLIHPYGNYMYKRYYINMRDK